jgi:Domain of unknown function (DUF4105)
VWDLGGWLINAVRHLVEGILIAWAVLAIYYSPMRSIPWRRSLAAAFAIFAVWALWLERELVPLLLLGLLYLIVVMGWFSIRPSNDRPWRPEYRVTPRAHFEGDRVRILGVRNFEYRSTTDFTVRYEERVVSLDHLTGVDFYVSYWMAGPVGHTFLSFLFEDGPPLTISIEARREVGETYAPIGSLFKQFELIYVVGDERDIVRVRTNYRGEKVYLYHLNIPRGSAKRLFLIYLKRLNALADRPEFYHLLSNSCTVNIVRYARAMGHHGSFNIRHYLNGLFDSYLYTAGRLDTSLPFEQLRAQSFINPVAQAADDAADFSARIRAALPARARNAS